MIVRGTVAAYTESGMEILHHYDGSMFGEIEFLHFNEPTVSELY